MTATGGRMDAHTALYCVLGNPVAHSRSPEMHNHAFAVTGENAAYVAFRVEDAGAAMAAVRALGIRGASVTVPHKVAVMEHLDEISPLARDIGAVNTVVCRDGRLFGTNTDGDGAVRAIEEVTPLSGKRLLLAGAGGAARAVGFAARAAGAQVVLANRSEDRGRSLARDLGAEFVPLSRVGQAACDVVVNATSVGMSPDTDKTPVPASVFRPGMAAMDIVYNPLRTRFLAEAAAAGCRVVDGVAMFVYQGAAQFELWRGIPAPVAEMRRRVLESLGAA